METKVEAQAPHHLPTLPVEIIDLILDRIYHCANHYWSSPRTPCQNLHEPSRLPAILPLRLVCKHFAERLGPSLFHHITAHGQHRHRSLKHLSRDPLSAHVRVLRVEVAPQDFGPRMKRVIHNPLVTVERKLLHYFEALPIFLTPVLARFPLVRRLHLTSSYLGIVDRRVPKNEALDPCIEALCKSVKHANMDALEELTIGAPYQGGFQSHFDCLDEKRHGNLLRSCGRSLRTASVKLIDHQGNYTTMPFF